MSDDRASLSRLRQQIDAIDDQLHDLLMERTRIVRDVAAAKALASGADDQAPHGIQALAMRPGREAEVVRRLVARHQGELPVLVIVRLWRELMTAKTRLQAPLNVLVYGGAEALAFWDLARFYFGSPTPLEKCDSPEQVLQRIADDPSVIGVLPTFEDWAQNWWVGLATSDNPHTHIVARLPFVFGAGDTHDLPLAYVVAPIPPEPTGDDTSLLAIVTRSEYTREALADALTGASMSAKIISEVQSEGDAVFLVERDGFCLEENSDTDLLVKSHADILAARYIGAYANPIYLGKEEAS